MRCPQCSTGALHNATDALCVRCVQKCVHVRVCVVNVYECVRVHANATAICRGTLHPVYDGVTLLYPVSVNG